MNRSTRPSTAMPSSRSESGEPETVLPSSRVAVIALALALATVMVIVGTAIAGMLDLLSEREMLFPLTFCLGASVLTGTLASIGWMHSRRRRDGRVDPTGLRRSLIAGALAGVILVLVTLAIATLGSHHGVETEIPPEATLGTAAARASGLHSFHS